MTQPLGQDAVTGSSAVTSGAKVLDVAPQATPPVYPNVDKAIVAIHGVGDQYSFATIQSVVNQFLRFYKERGTVPLGSFHGQPVYSLRSPYPVDRLERVAFAEVYWAGIPRETVSKRYILEETKSWGRTIVERLRMRWCAAKEKGWDSGCVEADFDRLDQVLTEMMSTVAVLERLCFLADKAGVFTFDLRKLLDDYLGDVQIVAEFDDLRRKIVDEFSTKLTAVHKACPNAEIYLVAHSEGTVVSFLGLLEAARDKQRPAWLERVRGLMTFGSPIDKHLILWPELFGSEPPSQPLELLIEWWNYYDKGDPIGFALDDARKWLAKDGWNGVFHFTDQQDVGFIRYAFPGKAHVDYWTDEDVFGHFIEAVVNRRPAAPLPAAEIEPAAAVAEPTASTRRDNAAAATRKPPTDRLRQKWSSYIVPYLGVGGLLLIGAYVLCRAVVTCVAPDEFAHQHPLVIVRKVTAHAVLLFGVTVMARVPRLTRRRVWRSLGWGAYLLSAMLSLLIVPKREDLEILVERNWATWIQSHWHFAVPSGGTRVIVATLLVVAVYWVSVLKPRWGLKPLLFLGGAAVAAFVAYYVLAAKSAGDTGPVWPVILAGAAFLYLWWLAALIFDLVFVWHVYIRQAVALERIRALSSQRRPDASVAGGAGAIVQAASPA